ncbi:MAG: VWA domain-containing protein [Bacteroidales bacterium]|nr:VWA domain-containing protein [Bacteroidales bacterium]
MASTEQVPAPLWSGANLGSRSADERHQWLQTPRNFRRQGWRRIATATVIFCALFGLWATFIWTALWFDPPRPIAVCVLSAGYETNLAVPHNVYGHRSGDRLAAVESSILQPITPPSRLRIHDSWDRDLAETASQPAVLIYCALHGNADLQGVYFLRDNADYRQTEDNKLRLTDMLDRLAELRTTQHKILVLDATQHGADWVRGSLRNEFARSLIQLNDRIQAIPNLIVISASGPDERSWSSPQYGESVFGREFRRAIQGESQDHDGDSMICLDEAFRTTAEKTEHWARVNRGSQQRPILLPLGDVGLQRAHQISLGHRVRLPSESVAPPNPLPKEVRTLWDVADQLRALIPPPQTYSPTAWRHFQDALLRYESLVEADDQENASRMRSVIRELEVTLRSSSELKLSSLGNTLTMPAVSGLSLVPDAATRQLAAQLWDASPTDAVKIWKQAQASLATDPTSVTLLRLQLTRLSLDLAATDPIFRKERLIPLLQLLDNPGRPRSAEAQFLLMLERDLPSPAPPEDLIRYALETRILAEQAALGTTTGGAVYTERVWPFTQARLVQADSERLRAQDLLFTNDPQQWAHARTGFQTATGLYRQVLTDAAAIADVLALRDRAFSELPALSRWAANRLRPDETQTRKNLEATVSKLEKLWADVYALDAMIQNAAIAAEPHLNIPDTLNRTAAAKTALDQMERQFQIHVVQSTAVALPRVWHDVEEALHVPDIPAELRLRLLENYRKASWQFFVDSRGKTPTPLPLQLVQERSDDEASRQGRLAMALLGQAGFTALGGPADADWLLTRTRLETFQATPHGWQVLLQAADSIAKRFHAVSPAVATLQEQAHATTGIAPLQPLSIIDSCVRVLPTGILQAIGPHPTASCRAAWLGRFLTILAQRTWQEHWYAYSPDDEPYFSRAGVLFLDDAAQGGDPASIAAVQRRLQNPGQLQFRFADASLTITTESTTSVIGNLAAAPGSRIPTGQVTWRVQPNTGLSLPPANTLTQSIPTGDKPAAFALTVLNDRLTPSEVNPPSRPTPITSDLLFQALFRGQRITARLPVSIYPRPFVTVNTFPSPQRASLAIRATPDVFQKIGIASGTVVVVLDCSGSMGVPSGEPFGPTAKFAQAVKVLEDVLRDLPEGTTLSVWAFGQSLPSALTADDAEKTISRVIAPTVWNPKAPLQLPGVMAKIRYPALTPWNESPILRTMLAAQRDFQAAVGYKTMIVVTDGMDNRYQQDKELNPNGLAIPALLRTEFAQTGIAVHIVGFKLPQQEEAEAKKQFEIVETFDPPGSYTDTDDADNLAVAIRKALRKSIRYGIETSANIPAPGMSRSGAEVGTTDGGERWFSAGLKPGAWKVRFHPAPHLVRETYLAPADRLLLELDQGLTGWTLRRSAWAERDFPFAPWATARDWRLSLIQNQREGAGYRGLVALERRYDPDETVLQVPHPDAVWFDLATPQENAAPLAMEWHATPGYPAAAWSLSCPDWEETPSGPARPKISVWWNPDQEPSIAGRLDKGIDFRKLDELPGKKLFLDGTPITIRFAGLEDHIVATSPTNRSRQKCLVVRVQHGPTHPVAVRVRGTSFTGHSLWQYGPAGVSTALFWPATEHSWDDLSALELISLRAMRRHAEQRGFHVKLTNLPTPDPADERPPPPLPLP